MKKGFKDLLAEANAVIETTSVEEALDWLGDEDTVFIDLRDAPELECEGRIPGALHASRGMLEFLIDPESPYHNSIFSSGKSFMLYCASGGRSAFAAQEMGVNPAAHIGGGLKAWNEVGRPIETVNLQV